MSFFSWERWLRWARRPSIRPFRRKKRPTARIFLEALEDRTLMSVLPEAIVTNARDLTSGPAFPDSGQRADRAPQVVISPVNSSKVVQVNAVTRTPPLVTATESSVVGQFSTDGGANWNSFTIPGKLNDPVTNAGFLHVSNPSVAIGRNERFYVTYTERDAANTSGVLRVLTYDFNGGSPTLVFNEQLEKWRGVDPILNPTVAIDNNVASFDDPVAGVQQQTDNMSGKAVYVAWNTNHATPQGSDFPPQSSFNPNVIKVAASGDGGDNFTTAQLVSDPLTQNYFWDSTDPYSQHNHAAPRIVFTQGSADNGVRVPGGQLVFVWDDFGAYNDDVLNPGGIVRGAINIDASRPDGGILGTPAAGSVIDTDGQTGAIPDAGKQVLSATVVNGGTG